MSDHAPVSADVVIVGGAAIGSSIAYHLAQDPAFKGRVVVVEKDPTYAKAASALSAASIRQSFQRPSISVFLSTELAFCASWANIWPLMAKCR
jgi:glycine/D-amino acid oxidase-like deaminating enzyme